MNEFYIFQQELLHSPNELPAENCWYINGDVYTEPWLFQKINITLITSITYLLQLNKEIK